jgi:3-oxoacyl-(acyl-carrier-protein) synthase
MTLTELATATLPEGTVPPSLPGFVVSPFSPLVATAADRCLTARHGNPPAADDAGRRTAIVLVSASGDAPMAEHVAHAVDTGTRIGPLLFFQAVPNSVAGHVAARWGLRGPVVCLCPVADARAEGLAYARLLIEDGDAAEVLVIAVDTTSAHAVLVGTTLTPQAPFENTLTPQAPFENTLTPQAPFGRGESR